MAEHSILFIPCLSDLAQSYDFGDVLEIYWDDSDDSFRVSFFDYSAGTTTDISSGGLILQPEIDIGFYVLGDQGYQFCTGPNLIRFLFDPSFPYAVKDIVLDSPTCVPGTVCDLLIVGSPKTRNASTQAALDGQIEVTASSSNPVRFSLVDRMKYIELPSSTDNGNGTYTYTFTSIPTGTYTIYAIDSEGCKAKKTVFVDYDQAGNYGLYRWFDSISEDVNPRRYRVEILKNNYDFSAVEIRDTSGSPIKISYRGENKGTFQQIIESEITVGLMNTSNFQFIDLFTQDDSEYLIKVIDNPLDASALIHQAYIVPQLYSEPFIDPPYPTFIKATDRLADLESFDFIDEIPDPVDSSKIIRSPIRGDNTVLDIMLTCLNKLSTGQGIRVAFNLYESSHDASATDDPLTQTKLNCDAYYDSDGEPLNCREVLQEIIKPLGARLFSSGGYWYLIRIKELINSSVAYREFNRYGVYVTNSTINPIVDFKTAYETDRAVMGADLALGIEECFGKISIIKNRDVSDTLFPPFSQFTLEDNSFLGWTPTLNGDSGSITAKEVIVNTDKITERQVDKIARSSRGGFLTPITTFKEPPKQVIVRKTVEKQWALRFNIDDDGGGNAYSSRKGSVEYTNQDSFQIVVNLQFNIAYRNDPPYARAKWLFKVGSKYLQPDGSWSSTVTVNEYFLTEYGQQSEYIITALFDEDASAVTTSDYEFRMYDISPLEYDIHGDTKASMLTQIAEIDTSSIETGYRLISRFTTTGGYYYSYRVFQKKSDNNEGSSVTPGGDENAKWLFVDEVSMKNLDGRGISSSVDYLKISFNTFPSGVSIEDEVTDTFTINTGNIRKLEYELFHFDLDTSVNNIENIVRNYFKRVDGTPTGSWGIEGKKLQKILSDTISELIFPSGTEGKRGAFRINGQFYIDTVHAFYNVFRDVSNNNRIFLVNACTWDLKRRILTGIEMVEIGSSIETRTKAYKDNSYSNGYS